MNFEIKGKVRACNLKLGVPEMLILQNQKGIKKDFLKQASI